MKKRVFKIAILFLAIFLFFFVFSFRKLPSEIKYGVSFSKFHSDELKLDWKETYLALLNDLGVKKIRLTAHWPNTEPLNDKFNFSELDFQIAEAEKRGLEVILAVGRRLPGWPECHVPDWARVKSEKLKVKSIADYDQEELLKYIETVVNRYKELQSIKYWQVENEPFLTFFSRANCGELDKNFLEKEVALVKRLDPTRSVLMTDSGEFGTWFGAYKRGDIFGTSLYLYIWNKKFNLPFRYPILPAFFRFKQNLVSLIYGKKPSLIIELSAEPWLLQPIVDTPIEVLQERMGLDKFNEMIDFAAKTGFDEQYLWGAEWWYWMKKQGYPEHWERAKELLQGSPL
ncbi:MAG: beta-galactosidase [Candidatus Yanofskybacteria bacterium]|nr:beta-galactosidase [Candidatus Yanofskybacteria bacterium]